MANRSKVGVQIKVSEKFFNNVFEKERRKFENKFNIKFTQTKFTEFLANGNVKFVLPKQSKKFFNNFNKIKKRVVKKNDFKKFFMV